MHDLDPNTVVDTLQHPLPPLVHNIAAFDGPGGVLDIPQQAITTTARAHGHAQAHVLDAYVYITSQQAREDHEDQEGQEGQEGQEDQEGQRQLQGHRSRGGQDDADVAVTILNTNHRLFFNTRAWLQESPQANIARMEVTAETTDKLFRCSEQKLARLQWLEHLYELYQNDPANPHTIVRQLQETEQEWHSECEHQAGNDGEDLFESPEEAEEQQRLVTQFSTFVVAAAAVADAAGSEADDPEVEPAGEMSAVLASMTRWMRNEYMSTVLAARMQRSAYGVQRLALTRVLSARLEQLAPYSMLEVHLASTPLRRINRARNINLFYCLVAPVLPIVTQELADLLFEIAKAVKPYGVLQGQPILRPSPRWLSSPEEEVKNLQRHLCVLAYCLNTPLFARCTDQHQQQQQHEFGFYIQKPQQPVGRLPVHIFVRLDESLDIDLPLPMRNFVRFRRTLGEQQQVALAAMRGAHAMVLATLQRFDESVDIQQPNDNDNDDDNDDDDDESDNEEDDNRGRRQRRQRNRFHPYRQQPETDD